jgi:hypothetical protein
MKFGREALPLKITSMQYFLILYLQPFHMLDVYTSEVDAKLKSVNIYW